MSTLPKYHTGGDPLYLRESAALGALEPVWISSVTQKGSEWLYTYTTTPAQPSAPQQYGDRRSRVSGAVLYLTEAELIPLCEALDLAEAHAQANLARIQAVRASTGCT